MRGVGLTEKMNNLWRTSLLMPVLLIPLPVAAAGTVTLVVRCSADYEDAPTDRSFQLDKGQNQVVDDLELGGSVEDAMVTIGDLAGSSSVCRIQTQYETSVSIAAEGPHLDLLDWVHFTSDWIDAKKSKKGSFRVPTISESERRRFPEVPGWELREAVLARGGHGWAELVKSIESAHESPAGVDISVIRVRAVCGTGSALEVLATLEFLIPMGC